MANLPGKGQRVRIEASADEGAALASDLGILGVSALSAELEVYPFRSSGVRVRGHLSARVTQSCVITLEPVDQTVEEDIDLRFLPESEIKATPVEIDIDPEAEDPPEPLPHGDFDLGQIVAEHLALGLDPYPRKEGVAFAEGDGETAGEEEPPKASPFARLKALRDTPDEA
ncbi:YceD family protein [Methylobrevis pamukkalensis]|uniref:YceD family protein n=1 Tax=Methylobrevis pamukkalensis TaxID=1439726 RepID=UPI001FD9A7D6|nr:DUF177 domain-containing protein [Methylobrevis pamukkalensis]